MKAKGIDNDIISKGENVSTNGSNLQQSTRENQQFINFQSKIFNLQSISNFENNLYKNSKD